MQILEIRGNPNGNHHPLLSEQLNNKPYPSEQVNNKPYPFEQVNNKPYPCPVSSSASFSSAVGQATAAAAP
jgi:hypothetical protein